MSTNLVFDGDASKYQEGDPLLELPQEKRAYVEEMAYYCQQEYARRVAAGEDWVLPEVALGQAILETGWGRSRGANDFGIKAWKGSDRPKSTLSTKEQNADGSYIQIDAAFEKTSSMQDSVALYYDFITSISRYSKALNLTDPHKSIQEIKAAGYATSHTYANSVSYIINHYNLSRYSQLATSFEYKQAGYDSGVSAYEEAMKIALDLKATIETSELNMKTICNQKPQIEYDTLIDYQKTLEIMTKLIDLLEKTKGIADRQKYIAEQYNGDTEGAGGLNTFQTANLALGTVNYAFNNNEDFTRMVTEYQNSGASEVFSSWFQSYVSQNGIESNVIDMKQYTTNIKETYAITSSDFVVSQAEQILSSADQNKVTISPDTPNKNSVINTNTKPNYTYSSNSNQQFTSNNQVTKPITQQNTTSPPTTAPITQPIQSENILESNTIPPSQNIVTDLKDKVEDYVANHNNGINSSIKDVLEQVTTPITSIVPEIETVPEQQPEQNYQTPTDSNISEVIPPTNDSPTKVTTTNDPTSNVNKIAIGVGIGAAAIGIGAGKYYIARRNKDTSRIEEDIEYLEEEEPIYKTQRKTNENPYKDNYYEDENNFFPLDVLDDNDDADDFNVEEEKYTIAAERNKNIQELTDYDKYHEDDYE